MTAGRMPILYVDDFFHDEVEQFGNGWGASLGAMQAALPVTPNRQEVDDFIRRSINGSPIGRKQSNAPDWVYSVVWSTHPSVSEWLKGQDAATYAQFVDQVMKPSAWRAFGVFNERCQIRTKRDGKVTHEKANLLAVGGMHGHTRTGDMNPHFNLLWVPFGIGVNSEQVKSVSSPRLLMKQMRAASELFHQSLAAGLAHEFGVQTDVVNGKAVIPSVAQQMGTNKKSARRQAMFDYLESKGIKATRASMAYAAVNTRPGKRKYEFSERIATWNREAGTVKAKAATEEEKAMLRSRLKFLFDSLILQPLKVISYSFAKGTKQAPGHVRLRNADEVKQFLEDTRPHTRKECHMAAVRAVRKTRVKGVMDALKVAERAFKAARKPDVVFPKNTLVAVADKAGHGLTKAEVKELMARCAKFGWQLHATCVEQEQQQKNGMRY